MESRSLHLTFAVRCMLFAMLMGALLPLFVRAESESLAWSDLTVKVEFEDPFDDLTRDQLMNLGMYVRVQALKAQGMAFAGMVREADQALADLKKEGVDVDGLLAQREEIAQLRMKRAWAVNAELDGKKVRMPGYALPLEYDGKKVTEFLLVPWVGACIHTPPPPPNQIVFASLEEGFEVRNRFEPVWVTGTMRTDRTSRSLFLVDGTADIDVGYSIENASAERYEKLAKKPVPRRGKAH